MSRPVWITEGGNLGTFPELEFFSMPLEVNNPTGSPVTFTFLSGELPPGLQVIKSGTLQGVPVVLNPTAVGESRTYKFTIRASCQSPVVVVDRTFSFTVSNIVPPTITPETTQLAEIFDGTLINIQLEAIEANPVAVLTWSLVSGELPPGVTLSKSGLLTGFVGQQQNPATAGKVGFDAQGTQVAEPFTVTGNVITPNGTTALTTEEPFLNPQQFEELPYDFTTASSSNRNYTFTVQVYDGANSDMQTYNIRVVAKSTWTTDNDINTVDDDFITVDADYKYNPIITTTVTSLPVVRQNSNIAFKFDAVDFYNSELEWSSNITSILPELRLNPNTGWLTGHIGLQQEYEHTYTFDVIASNVFTDGNSIPITYSSDPLVCSLTVLGDINNKIVWNSPSHLGSMINGSVSEFAISADFAGNAAAATNVTVRYKLLHGFLANGAPAANGPPTTSPNNYVIDPWTNDYYRSTRIGLPQGLNLLESGLVVGRSSFIHFSLDNNSTTIDGKSTTFDSTHSFTVQAEAVDSTNNKILVTGSKTFTITVDNLYEEPYENLYMKAFPTIEQRRLFRDIISDSSMFPDNIIYRLDDPNFGKAKEMKFLAMSGIAPSQLSTYANSMAKNHYDKTIKFSNVKTAIATDPNNNYAVKYEVVYVDIIDPFNLDNSNVGIEVDLLTSNLSKITNMHYDPRGIAHSMLYPNTFDNMQTRVETIGYSAQGVIPDWMTSVQEDKTVLGFKRALVLAYTKPGQSKTIAYRIKNRGIDFNVINFTIDRYQLDNTLSANYDIAEQSFVNGRSTTFDVLTLITTEDYDVVNYASAMAFDMINGKPFDLIKDNGGIDGVTAFQSGDRLIFGKQENITNGAYADGWVNYAVNDYNESYDSNLYDNSYVVPGYLEREANRNTPSLLADANSGDTHLYVPHISSQDYIGLMIAPNSFIPNNTVVTASQMDNSTGTLAWKLTLNNQLVDNAYIGDAINAVHYVTVVSADGETLTVSGLPSAMSDRVAIIGQEILGNGIPNDTVITNILGNVLYVTNPTSELVDPVAGDLIGYRIINQRSGIWELNINQDNFVTLKFIKEIAQGDVVKVLGGQSFGSCFLRYSRSIDQGNTVPEFENVPHNLSYNATGGGNGTTFDMGGTKIIERRDAPGTESNPIKDWKPRTYYPIGSIVKANSQIWVAVVNVMPTVNFVEKDDRITADRPAVPFIYWKLYDSIPLSGDKYLKFPQTGVFN
jgi:hypothetical protein